MGKKRNKYYFREKELIRLRMEDSELHQSIRNQGLIELDEPIHNGYHAEWILRADIARREDAAVFQEALDACKERIWSRNPEFRIKNRKTKKWEIVKPGLRTIDKQRYEALSISARKFFYETTESQRYWRQGFNNKYYKCSLSYELVIKITKAYITHRREHDNILYQMDAEIEKRMYEVAKNGNPWGYSHRDGRWWYDMLNKKEKLKAAREVHEKVKIYKALGDDIKPNKKLRELE